MTYVDQEPWPEPPFAADEATAIVAALERQRATLAWKSGGLDADGLRATAAASTITLGGLLKHMALIEDNTFTRRIGGRDMVPPWREADWDADPSWDWNSAADDTPEELYALYRDAVARSRVALAGVLAGGGLDQPVTSITDDEGRSPNLRRVLLDTLEEYARHAGHADIIRESVDGLTGEDRPD
ncbi:MAG: DinB family protein [Actinomycetota bacterium]